MKPGTLVGAAAALAALALAFAAAAGLDDYTQRVLTVICINVVLVASMGLTNGFTGVFSLGHVGFVAVGAYAAGILALSPADKASYLPDLPSWLAGVQLSFVPATLAAGAVCVVLGLLVGAPLLRLSGHFVSVATLGFLIIVNVVLINADGWTRGARTFTGVPLATTLPWAAGWAALTLILLARAVYSPSGRGWRAVREDTIAAQAVGIDVLPARLSAFVTGAFFAGVGGALYAHYLGSFSPKSFYFAYEFGLISMLVIGGAGSLTGAVVGVLLVTVLSELLRNLERGFDLGGGLAVPPLYGASQIALGVIFILVMVFRPGGLLGHHELTPRIFRLSGKRSGGG